MQYVRIRRISRNSGHNSPVVQQFRSQKMNIVLQQLRDSIAEFGVEFNPGVLVGMWMAENKKPGTPRETSTRCCKPNTYRQTTWLILGQALIMTAQLKKIGPKSGKKFLLKWAF